MRMQDGSAAAGLRSACAACKHQRKKCNENCILSCYFPAERNRAFKAVHKVFGVSNITKIIKNVKEDERRRVVDSLVWEACCRQKDPVQGPYGEYRKLFEEYVRVFNELKLHRNQQISLHNKNNVQISLPPQISTTDHHHRHHHVVQDFVAWENINGTDHRMCQAQDDILSFVQDRKNGVLESAMYAYTNCVQRQEANFLPMQQHPPHDLYFPGEFSPLNGKSMDSNTWEGNM